MAGQERDKWSDPLTGGGGYDERRECGRWSPRHNSLLRN